MFPGAPQSSDASVVAPSCPPSLHPDPLFAPLPNLLSTDSGELAAWCPGPGLKLQVFEDRESEGRWLVMSETVLVVGVLLMDESNSESLILRESGERVTDPGVMLGSSSMFFISHGFPGSKGLISKPYDPDTLACDEAAHWDVSILATDLSTTPPGLLSLATVLLSGHPGSDVRLSDQVLLELPRRGVRLGDG